MIDDLSAVFYDYGVRRRHNFRRGAKLPPYSVRADSSEPLTLNCADHIAAGVISTYRAQLSRLGGSSCLGLLEKTQAGDSGGKNPGPVHKLTAPK